MNHEQWKTIITEYRSGNDSKKPIILYDYQPSRNGDHAAAYLNGFQGYVHSNETPTQVIKDGKRPGNKSYMWVHRSGEFFKDRPVVIYEYQKGRGHEPPLAFYRDYKGVLVTNGLKQYHMVENKLPDLVNTNCWAHARRFYADAIKAADKTDPDATKQFVAYQALTRISSIYKLEGTLKVRKRSIVGTMPKISLR